MSAEEVDRILQEENLFAILGVNSSVETKEIHKAYKKMVRTVHPDRFTDALVKERAEKAFKRVGVAFDTLQDPLLRKDYERMAPSSRPSAAPESGAGDTAAHATRPAPPRPGKKTPPRDAPAPPTAEEVRRASAERDRKERAETLKQEEAEKLFKEAKSLERKNKIDDAISKYKEAIKLQNEVAKYHSHLAKALDQRGWGGYAQAEFKVALHFDPTDTVALKHYKPTGGAGKKGGGFKWLNLFRGEKGARIGDILIKMGHLRQDQLKEALKSQGDEKLLLGEILIRKKFIKPEQLAQALIHQAEVAKESGS